MVSLGQVFTRGQVADLLGRAFAVSQTAAWADGFLAGQNEAGERHMDVLAAALTAPPFRELGHRRDMYKLNARREADIAGSYPWRGDHPGGAVPVWDADQPPPAVHPSSRRYSTAGVPVRTVRGVLTWADEATR